MKQFILNILSWIKTTFFEKDILQPVIAPVAPVVTPPVPIVAPTPVIPPQPTKLDLWIKYITEMEGAKPERNNPGNLRYVGQKYAVDDGGFCKFDNITHGIDALKELLIGACEGNKLYPPGLTLYKFQCIYSPSSDNNNPMAYSSYVAKGIAQYYPEITINTPIKYLIS